MASLKEVRNRIVSVNSTQQITKAMKMVSAAKLRRATDAIIQMRPYSKKLTEMIATVSANAEGAKENPYTIVRAINKVLIIVVTSDRGLCGAFNANVGKAAVSLISEKYAAQQAAGNVEILALGKKGGEYLSRRGYNVNSDYIDIFTKLSFTNVRTAAEAAMKGFEEGKYDVVELVYNEFKNVATQILKTEQVLPIVEQKDDKVKASSVDYIFEPSEEEIINELIPKALKLQIYKAVLESNASEHGARMTAMDKATDNAGELLKELKLQYNRSRQAAITNEILEIVGGAEALAAA
ncbi:MULTISPECIES: ATP synthase F1 subunit gamma [unclassified Arcicella]|uniref:ATP synthase F1 subunit gamma n=1 Tax=unclassified Arcicella TaxID=2644986 RepID=UPI00285ADD59|nr:MULTISPECIES: ATP synthase F1 subunit gamma [unclassified Arcicella]MDR6564272.1 F-type H+-transporting ATPase subunit gamma [Arcicella sp. BE51]MDR6811481.1 F-type H+-transporting ATPase subunit gamma [Arcicella sp. BE140]MDR6826021.1 F-type H+-transporting ATPase subunit gamma [Arcicella sp. BE139]